MKFGRNYRLTIYPIDNGDPIIVTMPFTIKFDINRVFASSSNTMNLAIYNLSEINRKRIAQDFSVVGLYDTDPHKNERAYHNVILEMGYDNLYTAFNGSITFAGSMREGSDIVTRVQAIAGLFEVVSSQTFQTLSAGQRVQDVLSFLASQMGNLKIGAIGDFPDVLHRPVVLNGHTWDLIKQYSDGNCYIDNGKIFILQPNEVFNKEPVVIDDDTGLLLTPNRSVARLRIRTLLETSVNIFDRISLKSSIMPEYNGIYEVYSLQHEGTISQAVGGTAYTTFDVATDSILGYNPQEVKLS
jgi:hypothetical protein